jgi:hypothetical protein
MFSAKPLNSVGSINFKNYFTDFSDAPQNPLSQGGLWSNNSTPSGTNNPPIKTITSPNRAVGTQDGVSGFNDSYSILSGFRPNVMAQATVYKDPTIDTVDGAHEVELLMRLTSNPAYNTGYECNLSSTGAYAEIVRWDVGSFTYLAGHGVPYSPAAVTGDIFRVTIIGNVITTYINRHDGSGFVQIQTATDGTYSSGNPGIGMWLNTTGGGLAAGQDKFGFTDYFVTEV